jgi:peptide/nickel transport system substrate-binding protein
MVSFIACAATLLAMLSITGAKAEASTGGTLTIANTGAPGSLNPLLNTNTPAGVMYSDLAYEPLIYLDGTTYKPGLAVAWHYTDHGGAFVLRLRPNVHFSDGSLLTAKAVAKSLLAEGTDHGPVAAFESVIKSIKVTGSLTVRLNLTGHDPDLLFLLNQNTLGPDVVAPSALANQKVLSTTTDGTGPYMLDPSQTVSGSTYTYVPNPHYYDPSAAHYSKVVIQVIPDLSSELSALRDGQVQFASGSASTVAEAKADGLHVYSALSTWDGALLFDRNGTIAKPLRSLKVRQALNYAINRKADAQTLFGSNEFAVPTDEPEVPGYEGYVKSYTNKYPYNVAKAKKLLAEAGYPNGFDLTVGATTNSFLSSTAQANALASDWGAIGVKVQIKAYPTVDELVTPWEAAQLPVVATGQNGQPMYTQAVQVLMPNSGLFNPFKSTDPTLTKLMNAARGASTAAAENAAWDKVEEQVVKLAWFAPIAYSSVIYYASPSLKGVSLSSVGYDADPIGWSS